MKSQLLPPLLSLRFLLAAICPFYCLGIIGVGILPAHAQTAAAAPPTRPLLRIEAGMHTAIIRRIGVDAKGRFLVTGSDDKTVRVWSLADGKLLRVLRPPVGEGNEGKIYAVAISPDGRLVACGGWTSGSGEPKKIYLFDRESGALVCRIPALPDVVMDLCFSCDGKLLAAGLGGDNGVQVFRSETGDHVMADTAYGAEVYSVDFDTANRLVTACIDGFVRLYNGDLKLVAKVKAPGGSQPFSARFSPDASRVAVGYYDTPRVSVLSGSDLLPLYEPSTKGVNDGNLSKVSWSSDGTTLYAAGMSENSTGRVFVRRWQQGGRGSAFIDVPVTDNTIFDIRPLPATTASVSRREGGVVFASAEPNLGTLAEGSSVPRMLQTAPVAEYRDAGTAFRLEADASSVQFGYSEFGKFPARLSVPSRSFLVKEPDNTRFFELGDLTLPPLTEAQGLNITDWLNDTKPLLNGIPLPLLQYEVSRCYAISYNQQSFLLGTEWLLRCFGRDGKLRWRVPAPGICWAVNVAAGNGSVGIAGFGDGTIRWYRMKDGKELLAFFPHADKKRWVLWTPSGYYDCSPGGEDLIGWHINRGKDAAADFYPASRFRDLYYRPDVIKYILSTLEEGEAVRLANAEAGGKPRPGADTATVEERLPPIVSILSPGDGGAISSDQVTIRFTVRSPQGAPITAIRALIDGRPPEGSRGLDFRKTTAATEGDIRSLSVRVPSRDCEVSILAENKNSASTPATVRLRWTGSATPVATATTSADPAAEALMKPKLYVLAIGVSKYAQVGKVPALAFPAKDATDFAAAAKAQGGGLYREVEVKLLTDEKATAEDVLDGLEWVKRQATARDVAMVFLAGHGDNDEDGDYCFLPSDFDPERWRRTAVPYTEIQKTLRNIAGKALFFVDTCKSGGVNGGTRRRAAGGPDINRLANELSSAENGVIVFAASTGSQFALEKDEWGNGAFTLALVEALTGKAGGGIAPGPDAEAVLTLMRKTGKTTVTVLDAYLSERVKQLTGGKQTPTTAKPQTVPDFPIAALKN